ncbi:hypothetical protein [Peptoniphilus stercorisuis]|uniref:Type II secretory pathway component PulJ n=1 Tax=Peptoniphilus stercorisuis TaxID=1436965 RepID=A0ABS4KB45_9FIRM|nr:hypothetical protein [Peptoniphilus stercorisuis]MBP2025002.1 type II secretory pathway component PulJ [Peptoniphilus stercorisuis]
MLFLKRSLKIKAFTLIELVVSIGISILILSLLLSIFNISVDSLNYSNNKIDSLNKMYLASEYIRDDIESADFIIKNTNRNSLGFSLITNLNSEKRRATFYTFENKNLFRKSQNSNKDYLKDSKIIGQTGNNILIDEIKEVKCILKEEIIEIEIVLDEDNYVKRIFAIRTKK